jgi:hypothetical protein
MIDIVTRRFRVERTPAGSVARLYVEAPDPKGRPH